MPITPQDMIPDNESFVEKNGITIRKGTMAAILANADILADQQTNEEEKAAAIKVIAELMPGLIASGSHKHIVWKNPIIEKIMQEALARFST